MKRIFYDFRTFCALARQRSCLADTIARLAVADTPQAQYAIDTRLKTFAQAQRELDQNYFWWWFSQFRRGDMIILKGQGEFLAYIIEPAPREGLDCC